jgi:16S rRNA (cytosine1402-N4)-methyltransferase
MTKEILCAFEPVSEGIYIDATFGAGGHSKALLDNGAAEIFAIDRDPHAVIGAQTMIEESDNRLCVLQGCFGELSEILPLPLMERGVRGILFDLGVSSMQLDESERGFSYQAESKLDMRMGNEGRSAFDLVNRASENDLTEIFRSYGEERHAKRVAQSIIRERKKDPIEKCNHLAQIIARALPKNKASSRHPATRCFQALRIVVNNELLELARGLVAASALLKPEGILAVISFHSLEDRLVKGFFFNGLQKRILGIPSLSDENSSRNKSVFCSLTRKPIYPSAKEVAQNNRARSASLRIATRIAGEAPVLDKELESYLDTERFFQSHRKR